MHKTIAKVRMAAGVTLGVLILSGEAVAQAAAASSPWTIGAGIGFTAGPGTFLLDGVLGLPDGSSARDVARGRVERLQRVIGPSPRWGG